MGISVYLKKIYKDKFNFGSKKTKPNKANLERMQIIIDRLAGGS